MNDLIKSALPAIATALGGPLAGVAVNWLAGKLGVDSTNEAVTNALTGMTSDQLVAMKQMDLDFQKHMADNGIALQLAQIGTNTEEAKHGSIFVAGWRPFIGWVGGVSLAYVGLVEPFLRFVASVGFSYSGEFPVIDTMVTFQLVGGMLGLAGMRSYDKKQGSETTSIKGKM